MTMKLPEVPDGMRMNDRQRKFCWYYVRNGLRGMPAALEAGYSQKTAKAKSYQWVKNFAEYIILCQNEQAKSLPVGPTMVKSEMAKLAFANLRDFVEYDDKNKRWVFKSPDELTREQWAAVVDFKVVKGKDGAEEYHYKLSDKRQSILDLGRLIGMLDSKMNMLLLNANNDKSSRVDLSQVPTEKLEQIEKILLAHTEKITNAKADKEAVEGKCSEAK